MFCFRRSGSGPAGKAYGLDMTDEMLALANENKLKAGAENVEFLKGEIEKIPLPDNSVDVIISNCVINLSADKDRVLREAFRVLKPGGRFAVSDVVTRGEIKPEIRQSVLLWVGCVAGALADEPNTATNSPRQASSKLTSSRHESIGQKTRANSFPLLASTRMRLHPGRRQVHERIRARRQARERSQGLLRADVLPDKDTSMTRTLQRPISLHGQFGALHHGRGDSKPQRQA